MSNLDGDLSRLAVQQRQGTPGHPHVIRQGLQGGRQNLADVHALIQRLTDIEQEGKLFQLPLIVVLRRHVFSP